MINTAPDNIDNQSKTSLYGSIWVFIFVITISIWLYFYNSVLSKEVDGIKSEISFIESNVGKIKEDEKVKLYTLIKANSIFLDRYKYISNIPKYINNLSYLSKKYNISFEWFTYSNGELSTLATSTNDSLNLSYLKVKNFVEYFRNSEENIFALNFIDSFIWQENITFNTKFKIK